MKPFKIVLAGILSGLAAILLAAQATLMSEPEDPAPFARASCFDVVTAGETVHLLFGRPHPDSGELEFFHTRASDREGDWTAPVRVPTDHAVPGRHQRGHDPRLAVSGNRLLSLWTAEGDGPWGSGPLAASISLDGGKTWRAAPAPGTGAAETGYRFPAVAADDTSFHAIWIHAVNTERSLRHSRFDFATGEWSNPSVIDPHICACCWNQLKVREDGALIALYRDLDPSDMAMAISTDAGRTWTRTGAVGAFDWHFPGCPHVGACLALGLDADRAPVMLASVWTGHEKHGGAYILRGDQNGQAWQQASIPGPIPRGNINTDIALHDGGRAALVWDLPVGDGTRKVFLSTSDDAGESWSPPRDLSGAANATHPRVTKAGDSFLIFWTEKRDDGGDSLQIRATAEFPPAPPS